MPDSRPPSSIFPSSLVADPTQESVEKVGRYFLKGQSQSVTDEGAIPRYMVSGASLL
jgi:hypothetical protein